MSDRVSDADVSFVGWSDGVDLTGPWWMAVFMVDPAITTVRDGPDIVVRGDDKLAGTYKLLGVSHLEPVYRSEKGYNIRNLACGWVIIRGDADAEARHAEARHADVVARNAGCVTPPPGEVTDWVDGTWRILEMVEDVDRTTEFIFH